MQGRMLLLAEAQIRPGAQYPYALHTGSCNARGGGTRRLVPKSQVERRFQEAWYEPYRSPRRVRAHIAQLSQLRHIETENPLFFNGSSQKVCTTFARLFLQ